MCKLRFNSECLPNNTSIFFFKWCNTPLQIKETLFNLTLISKFTNLTPNLIRNLLLLSSLNGVTPKSTYLFCLIKIIYYICNLINKNQMKYFVSYNLDLIDGTTYKTKSYSKIIDLDILSEEEI